MLTSLIKKMSYKLGAMAECQDCGQRWEYLNAQALAAKHAAKHKHFVQGEIVTGFDYDGR